MFDSKRLLMGALAATGLAFAAGSAGAATLLHNWTFDNDGSDSAGSVDGALNGDAAVVAGGVFGSALSLDGDGDSVSTGSAILPTSAFTITAWVKQSDNSSFRYVAGSQFSGNTGGFIRIDSGVVKARTLPQNGSVLIDGGSVALDTWTHIAFTYDSTDAVKLYVNGVETASDAATAFTDQANFRIGARPDTNNNGFAGLIDDVAVFDGALTSGEIATVISLGAAAVPEPGSLALLGLGGLLIARRRRGA